MGGAAGAPRRGDAPAGPLSSGVDLELAPLLRLERARPPQHPPHERIPPVGSGLPVPVPVQRRPGALVNRGGPFGRLLRGDSLAPEPATADLRVEHLVGPVEIVEVGESGSPAASAVSYSY